MIPLYKNSHSYALRFGEIDACRESRNENIRCRDFLDKQIGEKFDGMSLTKECVENTVKEFGYDRTMWVIANTIQNRKGDGRFHSRNTEWVKRFNIPDIHRNYEFALNSHSCLVDGAADDIRKMYAELGLFSGEHIKVFGHFLSDGEKAEFCRRDFIGAIADEFVPDWAREKLAEMSENNEQSQDNSPEMKM